MAALTDREKRTVRTAAIAISIYLVLFFGLRIWKSLEAARLDYQVALMDAQRLRRELRPYENRVLLAQKLKENFHIEPAKLSRSTVVAEASAAIQKAASSGGVQLGPLRESGGRPSAKELASMQLEGSGTATAVMSLLQRLQTLGYPLLLDSVQLNADTKPGTVKLHLTIIILDFDQWKKEEGPNA